MQASWVILVSLAYAGTLFAVAWLGDRHASLLQRRYIRPAIYSLALAVYCSSWTLYGAVGSAVRYGLGYLPIYLGPLLMFLLCWRLVERLALVAQQQNTVSIADFIGSRFGRSTRLAAWVTIIALIAAIPYLALQYKAVATSLATLTGMASLHPRWGDPSLYVAAIMALFAILFGTRQVDATEHRPGLMLAVAFESIIKLVALVAVGVLALTWFSDQALSATNAIGALVSNTTPVGFAAQTLLAFTAIICLPRQFHVAIVECTEVGDIRHARWFFCLYLLIICLMILPIASAGQMLLGHQRDIAPDSYVLALPMAMNAEALALLAYIGGFSAATGMVIVVSVALSNMVSNDLIMPLLLRRNWLRDGNATQQAPNNEHLIANTARTVLWIRRLSIIALTAISYGYAQGIGNHMQLASFGLIAFAAVAQFAPALIAALYWQGASRKGVEAGLLIGFATWAYTLLLPNLADLGWIGSDWIAYGPLNIGWLRPYQLFGTVGWDTLTHSAFWSLLFNVVTMILVSLRWRPSLTEQMHARPFLSPPTQITAAHSYADIPVPGRLSVQDLQTIAGHVMGEAAAQSQFMQQAQSLGQALAPDSQADRGWVRFTELLLAGAVGASSARLLITRALQGSGMELAAVVSVLDEAGHELRFNRDILLATLENIDPGVSVIDAQMRLVAWNQRYQLLFSYPSGMLYVGRDVATLIRHNLQHNPMGIARKLYPTDAIEDEVRKRIELMRAGSAYTYVRSLADGRHIEIRGHPLPHGGYVTSYSDISAFKHAEQDLREVNETLEQRVNERTQELAAAHETRTRYLTAISHDVLQPLHAARLFASALQDETSQLQMRHLAERVDGALHAAEDLLDGILDLSRLDAGVLHPEKKNIHLHALMQELHAQYVPIAAKRGIGLQLRCPEICCHSDARLLRRVIQNFLANALRYTQDGRVLLSARRQSDTVLIQVWDTGPGIPQVHLARIYDEFHRYHQVFDWDGRGLGLGLSICQRIARLLDHPLQAQSRLGHGSVFSIRVPIGSPSVMASKARQSASIISETVLAPTATHHATTTARAVTSPPAHHLSIEGMRILCIDDDPSILEGMHALLSRWGAICIPTSSMQSAIAALQEQPECVLADLHLNDTVDGLEVLQTLSKMQPQLHCALISADGSDALRQRASALGYPVLTKPVKAAALRAFLMSCKQKATTA